MPKWNRSRWRAAEQIVQTRLADRSDLDLPRFPDQRMAELQQFRRRWEQALARDWFAAATSLKMTWSIHWQWLINDLQASRPRPSPFKPIAPTTAQVYRDLEALENEFESVDVDLPARTVTVHTDRIVLEELDLGPFAITWHWSRSDEALRVIAQQPSYADHVETIPHPHVREDELCVGEAEPALDQAFRDGRLFDAFLIVQQVLKTYNADSAYASLGRWSGHACRGCADRIPADESEFCESCGEHFCDDCVRNCEVCGSTVCHSCSLICPECELDVCRPCRTPILGRLVGLCRACHEKPVPQETPDEKIEDHPFPSPAA